MGVTMTTYYAIHRIGTPKLALPNHPSYFDSEWWNNGDGWGHKSTADYFTKEQRETLNLPLDGEWVEVITETRAERGVSK
jgi:hypothetical protein